IAKSTTILVDNTAPVTSFSISQPLYMKDGVRYITPLSELIFAAADPVISEVASKVERIEVSIDGAGYVKYVSALKFSEGRHSIKYRAIDNVGNVESEKAVEIQSDNTPPISAWLNTSDSIEKDNKFYLNAKGMIELTSVDPVINNVASGLEGIYYRIDANPENKYISAFSLIEGIRILNYSAKDNVSNSEVIKSTTIYVDGNAPVSVLSLSGDQYKDTKQYVSDRTDIIITAEDPVVNNVAVGIKETRYSIDGNSFSDYSSFKLNTEGKRIVSFYSNDYVNNEEEIKTSELWVDKTKPITELTVTGVSYSMAGDSKIYITKDSGIVLTSVDSISSSTASGILLTKYRIDGGNWQLYSGSFTITSEGLHAVDYYAIDKVQNIEGITTQSIIVDNTAPISSISLGEPKFEAFGLPVITPNTSITITAYDPVINETASGLKEIYYSIASPESPNPNPVFYTEPFTITEQGTFIVRYWTKDNVDNIEQSKEIKLAVMTLQQSVLIAVNELDMNGNSDIAGKVQSNGKVDITGSARIFGDVEAGEIKIKGHGEITGQQITNALPVNSEPIDLNEIAQIARELEEATTSQFAEYITDGKLSLKANTNLVITTGTYYFRGIDLIGGSSITISGNADIFVEGDISISGGSSLTADKASDLNIFMSSDTTINMSSKADLLSYLYAPKTTLNITGNVRLGGHYFVRDANLTGNSNVIQSGEELPELEIKSKDKKKFVSSFLAQTTDTFGIAGVSSEFTLREIYVFPNPSLGGQKPTFHIEVGIADSVKITIYTVSGRFAHNHIMTGMPITLDDGNGLDYAYEYTWSDNIPSGVYYYFIEAKKSGRTLKKTGKFAVVR
ncbi:MAG: polymer-forming cytoskeletal protein, partial [Elusimicrobiales bacterium]|nr:polymer-forming cytoskeletal protein [Elusimicrobiales bacterium]